MEVMNSAAFEQTNVLLGQAGQTQSYGVSDDPMLMSMLSTGLYANPLRTMLQEVMFNAWDAHRMGNCQDRPIDVYLNDTSGLIVRDYGPGISPEEIGPIYCIYGNSTKRKDDNQTGGFGLGSKSPFAYTDSFTVTNHFAGKKYMYVINRSVDENNGGPGMTPVINGVTTEESGLIVTVPFKSENDQRRAYKYIKDILYLSGIKMNLHYDLDDHEEPMELIEAESVAAGEFINNEDDKGGGLWAVYGGVRYKINEDDAYSVEYTFLQRLSRVIGAFNIGFAPNTLTPLPSREGLNLSEKTVESLKSQMETMQTLFMDVCKPACRTAMEATLQHLDATGIQSQFAAYRWKNMGQSHISLKEVSGEMVVALMPMDRCPNHVGKSIWDSMVHMAFHNTESMKHLIGGREFEKMKGIVFVRQFPKWKKYLNHLTDGHIQGSRFDTTLGADDFTSYIMNMNAAQRVVRAATDQSVDLRMNFGKANWTVVSGNRGGKKPPTHVTRHREEAIKKQRALGTFKEPTKISLDRWWNHADGKEVQSIMLHDHIIIAKTVTALNETEFQFQKYFAPQHKNANGSWYPMYMDNFRWSTNIRPIAAMVVHKKKGGYDKAKQTLKKLGFNVIEANEPEERIKEIAVVDFIGPMLPAVPKKRQKPKFPAVDYKLRTWASSDEDTWIDNPQCYFCCTVSVIDAYSYYSKPSEGLLMHVQERLPRTVILHNKQRETILTKKNIPLMASRVDDLVKKLLANKDRIRTMYLHSYAKEYSDLPSSMMEIPEMQKLFGIPYIRTKQKETFERDWAFLHAVRGERSCHIYDSTKKLIEESLEEYMEDPSIVLVRRMCDRTNLFYEHKLKDWVRDMKPGEKKIFSQKVARFLRTV